MVIFSSSPLDITGIRFVNSSETTPDKIESFSLEVISGKTNERQSEIRYQYQFTVEPAIVPFSSTTGVVENEKNIWLHPPRDKYFMILELNPFPYIRQPFKKGTSWKWSLKIGDYWKDERWKLWNGPITNNYKYSIVGKEALHTKLGKLDCWIVEGTAESAIGSTSLTGYFNESFGFVKLDYVNIDKSKVIIEIKKVI